MAKAAFRVTQEFTMKRITRTDLLVLVPITVLLSVAIVLSAGCERTGEPSSGDGQTPQNTSGEVVQRTPPPEKPELQFSLFQAIDNDNEALAMELIEQGAPIQGMSDQRGVTVLHRAAQMSMPNLTRLLLEYGADVHYRIDGVHHQPIHWAARAGCSERPGRPQGAAEATMDVLLLYGADINATTEHGVKPITYPIEMNAPAWKAFLISRGAVE